MAGSKAGGKKASETNKQRYGEDFYRQIGALGGSKSNNGGFGSDVIGADGLTGKERARIAGHKGGKVSKRGRKEYVVQAKSHAEYLEKQRIINE